MKWQAEKRPVTADNTNAIPETSFSARFNAAMVRSLDQVRVNIDNGHEQVLDARSPGRFTGIDPEPRPECRSGHIPNSLNLPFNELIDPDSGTVRNAAELSARINESGLDPSKPIVTTCGSGITACVLALGLHLTGRDDVAIYDGSWTEWGSRADTPVET